MTLPTFFVIGAPKSGTTSLHSYLAEHPAIAMSTNKEPMCFVGDDWRQRLHRYETLFEHSADVRGESSTAYTSFPFAPEVPERVAATVPDARLIYVVRDPVPRTLAHYAQNVFDGFAERPFDELMDALEDPGNMPVWCSRYATQLERWRAHFPADRILVLDQVALLADRTSTLQRVLAFLGVDAGFSSSAWNLQHNTSPSHLRPTSIARKLGPRAERAARAGRFRGLLSTPIPKPVLRDDQRTRLEALLRPEADRLRTLTGLAFADWFL